MRVTIPYGKEQVEVDFPESCEFLVPNKVEIKNEDKLIKNALKNPLGNMHFEEFVSKSEKLLIIVNDGARPTPTAKVLKFLYPTIKNHPNLKFLVATGVHRAPTKEEYNFIFGDLYNEFKDRIYVHDARKNEDMKYLGKSKNGTELYINRMVPETGNILIIGSVEPHYFAGFTGGRKSFLPGVSSYKTIEMNHKFALSEKAKSIALNGNPVHEDMTDSIKFLKNVNIFSIQTVLTSDHKIYAVTAGDIIKSFDAAVEYAKQIFCVPLKKKGNIVISVAPYPMDIDLYQSQKAIDNGKHALEKNGVLILVSKCRMGVGEDAFLKLLSRADTPEKLLELLSEEYKLGYHKVAKMVQIGTWAEMWAVSDLDDETIKKAMLKPYSDIQTAVDDAITLIKSKGKKPKIIVMPMGSLTIPVLSKKTS